MTTDSTGVVSGLPPYTQFDAYLQPVIDSTALISEALNPITPRPNFTKVISPYGISQQRTIFAVILHLNGSVGNLGQFFIRNVGKKAPHFVVYRDGTISQHVYIQNVAPFIDQYSFIPLWAVESTNPNVYGVQILHEGNPIQDMGEGYGSLTAIQYYGSVQLQRWILAQVPTINYWVTPSTLDPIYSLNNPGPLFPQQLFKETVPLIPLTIAATSSDTGVTPPSPPPPVAPPKTYDSGLYDTGHYDAA